ncbi:hypothetical protein EDB84DRAFT_1437276 [Lactarius hengduanensis]|nr:hypothetical protein EDB84DRAFT_1437276 [Lactarius hengduanensis]
MSSHIGKKARPRLSSKEQYHSSLRIVNGTTGQGRRAACGVGLVRSSIIWNRPQGWNETTRATPSATSSGEKCGLGRLPSLFCGSYNRWRYQAHCPREVFHAYMAMRGDETGERSGVLVQLDRILVEDIRAQYTRLIAKIGNGLTIFTSVLVPLYKALKIQSLLDPSSAFTLLASCLLGCLHKEPKIVDTGSNPVIGTFSRDGRFEAHYEFRRIVAVGQYWSVTKSPFLRLFHLRDTRFVYSTLLFEIRTELQGKEGLAVAAQNLHSDCKTRPITVPVYQLEMIIANRRHAIRDVVGGTTPEAERVQTWAAKIANGNPDMPMADENAFPRVPAASSHFSRYDVIERWEDKMGYSVFRDVFQGVPNSIIETAGDINLNRIRDRSEVIVGPGEWVKGWGRSGADFCYVHLCATGALKTPRLSSISYSRLPNLSFRMFLYRSSESPGVGDGLIGFDRVNPRLLWRRAGIRNTNIPAAAKSSSQVNLELSENTEVPAAARDLPSECGKSGSSLARTFITEPECGLLSAQSGVPAQRGHPV